MHTNLHAFKYLGAVFAACCMGCGGGTVSSPPSRSADASSSRPTTVAESEAVDSAPPTTSATVDEQPIQIAPASDNLATPVATDTETREPREPAFAAELLRVVDLRKLPRLNTTQVLDESATYVYYGAHGSVAAGKAFYNAELTAQDWQEIPTTIPESPEYADHLYKKKGFYLRVSIGSGSEEGTVGVSLSSLGNFEMTGLPRLDDAPMHEASTPVNVNYRTSQSIVDVTKFCRTELPKLGWQEYTGLYDNEISVPHAKSLNFRKNATRLMVSIARNPQTPTEVVVAYMADAALPFDLPVIAGGSHLKLELHSGKAEYLAPTPVNELAEFYQAPSSKLGWKLRAEQSVIGEKGATLYVEDGPEVGFAIQLARNEEHTKVLFQRLSFKETASNDTPSPPSSDVAANSPPPAPTEDALAQTLREAESTVEREMKKVSGELEKLGINLPGGLAGGLLGGPDQPAVNKENSTPPSVEAVTQVDTKPSTCRCKVFFGDKTYEMTHCLAIQRTVFDELQTVVFLGEKPLKESKLKAANWDELSIFDLTGFNSGTSMELKLQDGYASISCFIDSNSINLGSSNIKNETQVKANRLVGKVYLDKPEDFFDTPFRFEATLDVVVLKAGDRPAQPADQELTASEDYELPVPEDCANVSKESSPYRDVIEASIEADFTKVLKFYRSELTTRGWKEDAARGKADDKSAQLAFQGEQGSLSLKLAREDDTTRIQLSSRNERLAQEHGIAPKEGKAKLVLGNANEQDVVIVIDAQEYRLTAGQGAKDPAAAKKLDIEPGKHKIIVKLSGADPDQQEVDMEAGTTWGVIAFPGGGAFVAQVF